MSDTTKAAETKGPKMRERVDGLEQRLIALDGLLAVQASEIAALRADAESKTMQIDELRQQVTEANARAAEAVAALSKIGGVTVSQAHTLEDDELEQLLSEDPGRRLICVTGSSQLGLRPGEAFDPRHKFSTAQQAVQFTRGGVRFAPAPV